ncbi:MAG: GTP 3',8-cyclase MoaA [Candidatus Kariarchaeaceae archaeon]
MKVYPPLIDKFGRKIGSVRISVTDRCNFRCTYCMPENGITLLQRDDILTFEEITRLTKLLWMCGVKKFRLTGGEPTIREDLVELCQMLRNEMQDIDLSMTTNGLRLSELALPLKQAGVNRLNISIDTFDEHRFNQITRRHAYEQVIEGIKTAISVGFDEIKLNAVAIQDFNNDYTSLKQFIDFSESNGIEIRFIEFMPFTGVEWGNQNNGGNGHKFIKSKELRDNIQKFEKMDELPLDDISRTSKTWSMRDQQAKIGFISSISESFCDQCNRIRITAEGNLRPCLHESKEYPLRDLLRSGASDDEILEKIRAGINQKWKEHPDFLSLTQLPLLNDREMIRIGG